MSILANYEMHNKLCISIIEDNFLNAYSYLFLFLPSNNVGNFVHPTIS